MSIVVEAVVRIRTLIKNQQAIWKQWEDTYSFPSNSQRPDASCHVDDAEDKVGELVRNDGGYKHQQDARCEYALSC